MDYEQLDRESSSEETDEAILLGALAEEANEAAWREAELENRVSDARHLDPLQRVLSAVYEHNETGRLFIQALRNAGVL